MKHPTLLNGVILAAALGFSASALLTVLGPLLGTVAASRLVIPGLALVYLLCLFGGTQRRTGRVTSLALWSVMTLVAWWAALPLPWYLLLHVGAVWLVRSLYFYSGAIPALLDLGLSAAATIAAMWAMTRTGSVFLATWCFFLVQAHFVAIPPRLRSGSARHSPVVDDDFARARRQAEAALTKLAGR